MQRLPTVLCSKDLGFVPTETFGEWLNRARNAQGLSLRQLASRAGTSHQHISNIEANESGVSRDMVRQIADALGVPRSDAVRAWLEDDLQEGGAFAFVTDEQEARMLAKYGRLGPTGKATADVIFDALEKNEDKITIGGGVSEKEGETGEKKTPAR